jgi:hypothetical protein
MRAVSRRVPRRKNPESRTRIVDRPAEGIVNVVVPAFIQPIRAPEVEKISA